MSPPSLPDEMSSATVTGEEDSSSRDNNHTALRAHLDGFRLPPIQLRNVPYGIPRIAPMVATLNPRARIPASSRNVSSAVSSDERETKYANLPPLREAGRSFNRYRNGRRSTVATLPRSSREAREGVAAKACPRQIKPRTALQRLQESLRRFQPLPPSGTLEISSATVLRALAGSSDRIQQSQPVREKANRLRALNELAQSLIRAGQKLIE